MNFDDNFDVAWPRPRASDEVERYAFDEAFRQITETPTYRARGAGQALEIKVGGWLIELRKRHPRTRLLAWIDRARAMAADEF